MRLSKRLETIAEMVPPMGPEGCVADVGTDHGFVPIRLLELGRTGRAIAMDVREGPLLRAGEHMRQYGMADRMEIRLSDGLAALKPGEAQTVVIAGMGGDLMLRILKEGEAVRNHVRTWIFSPQSELERFRRGLEALGLAIEQERMLWEDGKYYVVMRAVPGRMEYRGEWEYCYGPCLIRSRSPVLAQMLREQKKQYEEIAGRLKGLEGKAAAVRLAQIQKQLALIEEAFHEMQRNH